MYPYALAAVYGLPMGHSVDARTLRTALRRITALDIWDNGDTRRRVHLFDTERIFRLYLGALNARKGCR